MEAKINNIYEKLSAITGELSAVAKNLEVGFGQNKYKAVGEADVLKAVKPLEVKYKVYSYPYSRKIIESGEIESTNAKGEIRKNLFERIEVIYRFVNTENPEDYIDITSYGDGIDSQDKSVGKAMTYADKYALLKAYKIITGEDPDQYASEETVSKNTKPAPKKPELAQATTKKEELDENLLSQVLAFTTIEKLQKFYKVETLTNDHLQKAIDLYNHTRGTK